MAELKTFLFTDICGSVRLKDEMIGRSVTERDLAFINAILTPHRERIEQRLEEFGGRVVSTAGDGHFLVFTNTIAAAQWAVEVQRSHRDEPITTPDGGRVEVRISMHVGVPQIDPADADNFVGKSVDYAARLNDYATANQTLVSRSVMAIVDDVGLDGVRFHLHGRRHLKGIGRVEVHELLCDEEQPRQLRERPKSHSDRQWTVVPTIGFEGGQGGSGGSSGAGPAVAPALRRVGNYELEELLGSGGMGDVYKARHRQFGRVRAVKVIKPQFVAADHQDVKRRFYQEIKAIGALEHKNIVVAIDSSLPDDQVHYLVMEHIEGVSLSDLVDQRGVLSVSDACEIIRQAAQGLQFIHKNGMVHRDIKPSNLMLTVVDADTMVGDSTVAEEAGGQYGLVKILDLGLALLASDHNERLTLYDNRAMGTGMYMSPEQWKTTSVDIRADIYSLGCTFYHLLAGSPPFADSDLRPEKAHEKSRVPPLPLSSAVPRRVWDVLRKMLAKSPEDRYETPADVAVALTECTEGHNLVRLVQEYIDPDAEVTRVTPTRPESGTSVDTWLSKTSHLMPTRRWVLRRGLPMLAVCGAAAGGAGYGLSLWRGYRREQAQAHLPVVARLAVKDYILPEIDRRFGFLVDHSLEYKVSEAMDAANADPTNPEAREPLQGLVDGWYSKHQGDDPDLHLEVNSWFVIGRSGIQLARSPAGKSVGKSYRHRDYFHGLGKDLPEDEAQQASMIRGPHLSAAYKSTSDGTIRVAFSIPIPGALDEEGEIINAQGVLAMSVDVGKFNVLDEDFRKGNDAVLIDLRTDTIAGEERQGLVLHHPRQEEGKQAWVSPELFEVLNANEAGFTEGYLDPVDGEEGGRRWGAFERVPFTWSEDPEKRKSGCWAVLIQQPMA